MNKSINYDYGKSLPSTNYKMFQDNRALKKRCNLHAPAMKVLSEKLDKISKIMVIRNGKIALKLGPYC